MIETNCTDENGKIFNTERTSRGGITTLELLTLMLVFLKIMGYITCNWFIVFIPFIFQVCLTIIKIYIISKYKIKIKATKYYANFFEYLFVLFVGLKLANIITWSWWIVTLPIWGTILFFAVVLSVLLGILYFNDKNEFENAIDVLTNSIKNM